MKANNKTITIFLTLLLLGIWGAIVYQLFIAGNSGGSASGLEEVNSKAGKNIPVKYEYIANVRDPFGLIVPAKKKTIPQKIVQAPLWTPPPFKLTGIVLNDKKRTAMLESNDGSIYFLKEGDSLGSLKIQSIHQSMVAYSYLNGKGIWNIER
jgi:hypothetical protein